MFTRCKHTKFGSTCEQRAKITPDISIFTLVCKSSVYTRAKLINFFCFLDCKKEVQLFGDKGNFTSPGGYEGYPNNTNCR